MDTEQMIELARRIVVDGRGSFLIGESPQVAATIVALDDARVAAERERDEARDGLYLYQQHAAGRTARVAVLEAALEKYGWHKGGCAYLRRHTRPGRPKRDGRCDCGFDAALGDQEAPIEPLGNAMSFDGSPKVVGHALGLGGAEGDAGEAECTGGELVGSVRSVGGTGGEVVDRLHDSILSRPSSPAAPQVAPEPERCPTCKLAQPCPFGWHRTAPPEGEQR